jgi:hypothetical protein
MALTVVAQDFFLKKRKKTGIGSESLEPTFFYYVFQIILLATRR